MTATSEDALTADDIVVILSVINTVIEDPDLDDPEDYDSEDIDYFHNLSTIKNKVATYLSDSPDYLTFDEHTVVWGLLSSAKSWVELTEPKPGDHEYVDHLGAIMRKVSSLAVNRFDTSNPGGVA